MLGLPGESHDDMLATARELARVNIDAVKIHNLYCVKNTRLADQVAAGEVTLMEPRRLRADGGRLPGTVAADDGRRTNQRRRPAGLISSARAGASTSRR